MMNTICMVSGMRPLHYAAWQGTELGAISMLLDAGSSSNEGANDGMTPLHLACEHGHLNVVGTAVVVGAKEWKP